MFICILEQNGKKKNYLAQLELMLNTLRAQQKTKPYILRAKQKLMLHILRAQETAYFEHISVMLAILIKYTD